MSVALACSWKPRGEMPRLRRFLPQLSATYVSIIIALRDPTTEEERDVRAQLPDAVVVPSGRSVSRFDALRAALEVPGMHVHLADMDRLLHWVETRPDEWRATVAAIPQIDCLVVGRTDAAFASHPKALQDTERIINAVFSHALGGEMDFGGGMRGFSRRAVEHIVASGLSSGWYDTGWPVLLHRAGMGVGYRAVDGMEWESADHRQATVADSAQWLVAAAAYDADPAHWAFRVEVAHAIVAEGLAVIAKQPEA